MKYRGCLHTWVEKRKQNLFGRLSHICASLGQGVSVISVSFGSFWRSHIRHPYIWRPDWKSSDSGESSRIVSKYSIRSSTEIRNFLAHRVLHKLYFDYADQGCLIVRKILMTSLYYWLSTKIIKSVTNNIGSIHDVNRRQSVSIGDSPTSTLPRSLLGLIRHPRSYPNKGMGIIQSHNSNQNLLHQQKNWKIPEIKNSSLTLLKWFYFTDESHHRFSVPLDLVLHW